MQPDMRTVIPLSPDLGNSEISGLLDTAEQDAGYPARASDDVEVMHGCESEHVATVRAACHEKHVRGGRA